MVYKFISLFTWDPRMPSIVISFCKLRHFWSVVAEGVLIWGTRLEWHTWGSGKDRQGVGRKVGVQHLLQDPTGRVRSSTSPGPGYLWARVRVCDAKLCDGSSCLGRGRPSRLPFLTSVPLLPQRGPDWLPLHAAGFGGGQLQHHLRLHC